MALKLITDAATEPVTLEEAKVNCRVDSDINTDDALIEGLITAVRKMAEQQCGRAFITQTWERVLDAFPAAEIELGMPTALGVESVTYIDAAGDSQVMSALDYSLDSDTQGGFLLPAVDTEWPDTLDTANAVRVRFTAGYGASASAVPQCIKTWIKLMVGHFHPNGDKLNAEQREMADRLLDSERVWG